MSSTKYNNRENSRNKNNIRYNQENNRTGNNNLNRKRQLTKAEIRRNKQKKRRIRKIKYYFRLSVYICLLCVVLVTVGRCSVNLLQSNTAEEDSVQAVQANNTAGKQNENNEKEITQDINIEDTTEKTLSYEEKLTVIEANTQSYPEELLVCAKKYPQTIDFVYNYPDKADEGKKKNKTINLTEDYTKGKVPLLLQWDERWGYTIYGSSVLGIDGCGPTSVSMVYTALTGDVYKTPHVIADFSEDNGYYVEGSGTSWTLMTKGIEKLGLHSTELMLSESVIKRELDKGSFIICSVGPGDFTYTGHFIVIRGYTKKGFEINDPNSITNSNTIWVYDKIVSQIKNLWAISK